MTENESINGWTFEETVKTAENLMEAESNMFKWDVLRHLRDFTESFKYELEQYRAIGTVEEFQHFITAWDELKILIDIAKNELSQYKSIGTVEEFKALKEKATPMELEEHNFQDEPHHYLCPNCRCIVSYTQNYCEWCGQALET